MLASNYPLPAAVGKVQGARKPPVKGLANRWISGVVPAGMVRLGEVPRGLARPESYGAAR